MKLLVFAFKDTIAEQVANNLQIDANRILIESTIEAIDELITSTRTNKYDCVLGMGSYSGRDRDQLRIETECSSQFRNNKTNLERVSIPYFLQPNDDMRLAKGIGNSWCNLVSYKFIKAFPSIPYTFIHVPKLFSIDKAAALIDLQIKDMPK